MASSVVQIRVDDQLRNQAAEIYEKLGIDLPTAVRIFLKRSVLDNGIPFAMTLPRNEYMASQAIRALDEIQANAAANGTVEMSLDEINKEIADARRDAGNRREGL